MVFKNRLSRGISGFENWNLVNNAALIARKQIRLTIYIKTITSDADTKSFEFFSSFCWTHVRNATAAGQTDRYDNSVLDNARMNCSRHFTRLKFCRYQGSIELWVCTERMLSEWEVWGNWNVDGFVFWTLMMEEESEQWNFKIWVCYCMLILYYTWQIDVL